jgi:hypothetical protein
VRTQPGTPMGFAERTRRTVALDQAARPGRAADRGGVERPSGSAWSLREPRQSNRPRWQWRCRAMPGGMPRHRRPAAGSGLRTVGLHVPPGQGVRSRRRLLLLSCSHATGRIARATPGRPSWSLAAEDLFGEGERGRPGGWSGRRPATGRGRTPRVSRPARRILARPRTNVPLTVLPSLCVLDLGGMVDRRRRRHLAANEFGRRPRSRLTVATAGRRLPKRRLCRNANVSGGWRCRSRRRLTLTLQGDQASW